MENTNDQKQSSEGRNISRRDVVRGLAAIPVLGAFFIGAGAKSKYDTSIRDRILKELNVEALPPPPTGPMTGDPIRIGIIGFGIRGEQLIRALGFPTKSWIDQMKQSALENRKDTRLQDQLEQENLNVRITGVCDLFDVRADEAMETVTTDQNKPKRFKTYKEMLESPDIDAVVIASPDHWHAPMAIDAAQAGKHVYIEKCMTHKLGETYELYDVINNSPNIVFQVGHQHRQTQSFLTAQDIIRKNVLGHINLIEVCTNRNDDIGAWQYEIHEKANPQTIDWQQFLGDAPQIPFNLEHFFRWRKWWAYGTGLAGDLLTHDYDRINCLLNMGIPSMTIASGGIYTHRDGREVPDVFQVVMEYPDFLMGSSQEAGKEKGMSFLYSATLGNQYDRTSLLMGHDATMELGASLFIQADPRSSRYQEMIEEEVIKLDVPMYSYNPAASGADAVTGATAKYFANKGLMYTYRDGKRLDSTFLHMREWLSCIRNGGIPSCGIEEGFQEAISAHMSTISLRTGKRVDWDHETKKVKNFENGELEEIGMV